MGGALNRVSFNPLWINTALKRNGVGGWIPESFNPLWINTALKRWVYQYSARQCFNPLWINTALKRTDQAPKSA